MRCTIERLTSFPIAGSSGLTFWVFPLQPRRLTAECKKLPLIGAAGGSETGPAEPGAEPEPETSAESEPSTATGARYGTITGKHLLRNHRLNQDRIQGPRCLPNRNRKALPSRDHPQKVPRNQNTESGTQVQDDKACYRRLPPTSEQEPEPTFELEPKSKPKSMPSSDSRAPELGKGSKCFVVVVEKCSESDFTW
ncbi:hypothetical protein pipiens_003268 [Culex pipiens pipiens]|uniref:Uncharacterized protein n=1 Tax=Culex pipiens pipiens TaxID=38569 RepID=A0ABD1D0U2_CULPP